MWTLVSYWQRLKEVNIAQLLADTERSQTYEQVPSVDIDQLLADIERARMSKYRT